MLVAFFIVTPKAWALTFGQRRAKRYCYARVKREGFLALLKTRFGSSKVQPVHEIMLICMKFCLTLNLERARIKGLVYLLALSEGLFTKQTSMVKNSRTFIFLKCHFINYF